MGTLGSTTITVAEVAPLLGLASLGAVVKGAAVKGLKLRAALSKREAEGASNEEEEKEGKGLLSLLEKVEPEDCYKRTFCALATGEVVNWRMTRLLNLLDEAERGQMEERRPFDKLLQAAQYGATRNIAKCEARYQCTFSLAEIEQLYQH